jgi:TRAP-type C4-dicarboxylate transport system substrate-binding protein
MSYGEVYSGLQMGLIDAQVNPLFAIYSMKFYEVQDYLTQLKSEPFIGIPTVNEDFYNGLPKEVQDEMRKFWIDAIVPAGNWITKRNADDMEKMKAAKPSLKFHVLDDATIAKFKAQAETVYPEYPKIGGDGAQAILDALLQDIANAKKALNIK